MKYKVIWSAFSEKQLDDVFEYYKNRTSIKIAKNIIQQIVLATEPLKTQPKLGHKETVLANRKIEYRYIIVTNYKIIYSIDDTNHLIKIADVFDTRQNPVKIEREK